MEPANFVGSIIQAMMEPAKFVGSIIQAMMEPANFVGSIIQALMEVANFSGSITACMMEPCGGTSATPWIHQSLRDGTCAGSGYYFHHQQFSLQEPKSMR